MASGSAVESRDSPGSCLLPATEPASEALSSWFRLSAADPAPRSDVCLNHDGSFAPSDCAIWLREMGLSGEDGSGVSRGELAALLSAKPAAIERGRRALPALDCGLRCHESVPDRPNAAALGAVFFGSSPSGASAGGLVRRCKESSRADCCDGGSIAGVGVSVSVADCSDCGVCVGVCVGVVGLSGDRVRARSDAKHYQQRSHMHCPERNKM
jgi:hypothetical protein